MVISGEQASLRVGNRQIATAYFMWGQWSPGRLANFHTRNRLIETLQIQLSPLHLRRRRLMSRGRQGLSIEPTISDYVESASSMRLRVLCESANPRDSGADGT